VAEEHCVVRAGLSALRDLPAWRALWLGRPNETCRGFGPVKHRRGQGRQHVREFLHFLFVANGSLAELDTQRIIAESLHFISPENSTLLDERITEIRKMLYALSSKLKTEN